MSTHQKHYERSIHRRHKNIPNNRNKNRNKNRRKNVHKGITKCEERTNEEPVWVPTPSPPGSWAAVAATPPKQHEVETPYEDEVETPYEDEVVFVNYY